MNATVPNKKKGTPPDQSVKIASDVVQMARTVVSVDGGSMAELIAEICRPILREKVKQMQARGVFLPPPPDPKKDRPT